MRYIILLSLSLSLLSGCATSTDIGYLHVDCSTGFFAPNVCLATAHVVDDVTGKGTTTLQQVVSGHGVDSIIAPAVSTLGGAALLGPLGLAHSGAKVSQATNGTSSAGAASNTTQFQGQQQGQSQHLTQQQISHDVRHSYGMDR